MHNLWLLAISDRTPWTWQPGGRLMISDIVLLKELPEKILKSAEAYVRCISGAMLKDEYLKVVKEAGFGDVEVLSEDIRGDVLENDSLASSIIEQLGISHEEIKDLASSIVSLKFSAVKPK